MDLMILMRDLSGMSKKWSSLYRSSRKRWVCEQKKKGRECQRNFPKILITVSGLLESVSGHGVTRGSVVRHP